MISQGNQPWRREALFQGMTPNAFRLGTVLTQGWFWVRRSGCAALYRGPSLAQVDVSRILHMADAGSTVLSLPAHLSPPAGAACCYLLRRFNSRGCQEQTTGAAVVVRIGPDGKVAPSAPNGICGLKHERVEAHRFRLTWLYWPLDQEAAPQEFRIYGNSGTGQIDLEHPIATVPYGGRRFYEYETEPLDDGLYAFAVRPCSADQVESMSVALVLCPMITIPPEAPTLLAAGDSGW